MFKITSSFLYLFVASIANLATPKADPMSLSWPTIISSPNVEDINSDQNSLFEPPPTKYISLFDF